MDTEDSLSPRDKKLIGNKLWEYVGSTDDDNQANIFSRSKWECSALLCHCRKRGEAGVLHEEGG